MTIKTIPSRAEAESSPAGTVTSMSGAVHPEHGSRIGRAPDERDAAITAYYLDRAGSGQSALTAHR